MKITTPFLLLLLSCNLAQSQNTTARLDELLSAYAKQYKFNGSVLVAQKGKLLIEKGYGYRNRQDSSFNNANTIFQIGSVTKQFTSAIILKLQEQGKLSVKDKINKYFPGYPKGDSITIGNLLTHSSGIYNYTNDGRFMNSEATKPQTKDKMVNLFRDRPLGFSPGSNFSYSNSGYYLLGMLVEKVSGKPWETMMHEMIFAPLQMNHSGFDFTNLKSPEKATGYFFLDSVARQTAPIIDSTVAYAAGSLFTTVGDLYKWERAIYTNKILKPESWKQAFTPYKNNYGYGWIIDSLYDREIIWHNGGIYGFSSHLLRFPKEELVIILISNKPGTTLGAIANNIGALVFGLPYEIPNARKEIVLTETTLQKYVGEYELTSTMKVTIVIENGKLKTQITGQPKIELFAEKEDRFFMKVVDVTVDFQKGADGKVDQLVITQDGVKHPAKRIK